MDLKNNKKMFPKVYYVQTLKSSKYRQNTKKENRKVLSLMQENLCKINNRFLNRNFSGQRG